MQLSSLSLILPEDEEGMWNYTVSTLPFESDFQSMAQQSGRALRKGSPQFNNDQTDYTIKYENEVHARAPTPGPERDDPHQEVSSLAHDNLRQNTAAVDRTPTQFQLVSSSSVDSINIAANLIQNNLAVPTAQQRDI
jgi:hypothetical protein